MKNVLVVETKEKFISERESVPTEAQRHENECMLWEEQVAWCGWSLVSKENREMRPGS